MRSKQVIKRFLLAILLGGPVLGAQAQSTGPLVVEERGSGGDRASSSATGNGGGEEGIYLLMQEMEQYQKQVQNLQGQVEELRHELNQLKGAERERYLDLDTGLTRWSNK